MLLHDRKCFGCRRARSSSRVRRTLCKARAALLRVVWRAHVSWRAGARAPALRLRTAAHVHRRAASCSQGRAVRPSRLVDSRWRAAACDEDEWRHRRKLTAADDVRVGPEKGRRVGEQAGLLGGMCPGDPVLERLEPVHAPPRRRSRQRWASPKVLTRTRAGWSTAWFSSALRRDRLVYLLGRKGRLGLLGHRGTNVEPFWLDVNQFGFNSTVPIAVP